MTASDSAKQTRLRTPIYIEIPINSSLERVWELSQNPDLHPRWDLRFTRIVPLFEDDRGNTHFRYEFELLVHTIHGTGVSLGNKFRADGQATSVLKFDTQDFISPIGKGAGYWRYVPTDTGVRFITGYNYEPSWGILGKALDTKLIRPALGWATALSLDRLRLWAESDISPETSLQRWALDAAARAGLIVSSAALFYKAQANKSIVTAAAAGVVLAVPLLLKRHWSVPRASRCLRTAPDAGSAKAPRSLTDLAEPKNSRSQSHPERLICAVNL